MFRFIIPVVVVNLFLCCSGAPAPDTTMLSDKLTALMSSCENQFLIKQINATINNCSIPVHPYHEKQIECLLFYDINQQLCEAVNSAKLVVAQDDINKIDSQQEVSQLCNTAKDWTFKGVDDQYRQTVNLVFHNSVRCSKVCSEPNDDIFNIDSTFICKYFKWGSEMLQSQASLATAQLNSASLQSAQGSSKTEKVEEPVTQIKGSELKTEVNNVNLPLAKQSEVGDSPNKNTEKISATNVENSKNNAQASASNNIEDTQTSMKHDTPGVSENGKDEVQPVLQPINTALSTKEENQPTQNESHKDEDTSNTNKNAVDNSKIPIVDDTKKGVANNDLLNQLENPKPNDNDINPDDDDSGEGHDGLSDNQDEDLGDDTMDGFEPKLESDLNKKPAKSNDASMYSNDILQKEIYPNTISDGFTEDDDHFFSFFLTAIIMVILLYILYHNKSKVSKVFLGLILEGRQTNRRRNSRGHAYRRLDTLEQAMSANTAAPPSKIIY